MDDDFDVDDFDVDDIDVDAIVARHHALEQKAHQKLREHWGHTEFRANQLDALQAVLRGQDCLVVMATGSGKSLCYQLVPLVTGVPAVVVSPLIALMQDQVLALQARGVRAVLLGSAQADRTAEARAMAGEYDLVYVTPELLAGGRLDLAKMQRTCGLSLLAVDEAHCVCEWGFDFRPDYARIGGRRPAGVPLMALTATAPPASRQQLCSNLRMAPDALKLVGSLARRGLELRVCAKGSSALTDLLPLLRRARRDGALPGHAAALIYVPTVSEAEAIGAALRGAELRVGVYHAASPDRASTHQRFVRDELDVVVATIAFGMGVDKPDVRLVVHYGPAATPEQYYQQAG